MEDYTEPRCPLCMTQPGQVTPIPMKRVYAKLDDDLSRRDYAGAERHLVYWLGEAEAAGDEGGMFAVCNELMGLKRKLGDGEAAMAYAERTLALSRKMGKDQTAPGATAMVNAATVYKAFGQSDRAIELFREAEAVYQQTLQPDDSLFAALYNNMALALVDVGQLDEAAAVFSDAIGITTGKGDVLDAAISHLNLADCLAASGASGEKVLREMEEARKLLDGWRFSEDRPDVTEGYYAFVCEKCAPAYRDTGNEAYADELAERSRRIYERT